MKMIGIDIGTTTISGVIVQQESTAAQPQVIYAETTENGSFLPTQRDWERIQDVEKIIKNASLLLDRLMKKCPDASQIGLTGQMHGILYLNCQGKCVSPLYTWQDARAMLPEPQTGLTLVEEVERCCGKKVPSGYGFMTHLYNLRHGLIPEDAVTFCTIMDYFGMILTQRKKPLIHAGNAASFGFFHIETTCFETELLSGLGIPKDFLPEVCAEIQPLGTFHDLTVTTAIGDNQASFLGSAGTDDHTLLINMGTGGQISILSDLCFSSREIEARPFFHGKYLLAGASLCGGKSYALVENFFRQFAMAAYGDDRPQYEILERLARLGKEQAAHAPNDRLSFRTTFDGTRADPSLSGEITHLTSENFTPAAFVYGALEGMIRELYEMFHIIQNGTGVRPQKLIGSGNGIRKNPVLCEIIRETFGIELVLATCQEEAATGAAISTCM